MNMVYLPFTPRMARTVLDVHQAALALNHAKRNYEAAQVQAVGKRKNSREAKAVAESLKCLEGAQADYDLASAQALQAYMHSVTKLHESEMRVLCHG